MNSDILKRAIEGAYQFCEQQQTALDSREITEEQWFINRENYINSCYLASDNPRAQSGHRGNEKRYRYTQAMILNAIEEEGSFIDVGCANGYLIEKLDEWCKEKGKRMDFYGVDISRKLADLAKRRLPEWKERIFHGNALYWIPPRRFRYVCVKELGYVPNSRKKEFFMRLLDEYTEKDGRLILGPWVECKDNPGIAEETSSWGYPPTGGCSKPHQDHEELARRLYWYNATR